MHCPQLPEQTQSSKIGSGFRRTSDPSDQSRGGGGLSIHPRPRLNSPFALLRRATWREIVQISLTSVVSWSLVSGYKTLLGAG